MSRSCNLHTSTVSDILHHEGLLLTYTALRLSVVKEVCYALWDAHREQAVQVPSNLSLNNCVVPFLEVILHVACPAKTRNASKNAIARKLSEEIHGEIPRLLIEAAGLAYSGTVYSSSVATSSKIDSYDSIKEAKNHFDFL